MGNLIFWPLTLLFFCFLTPDQSKKSTKFIISPSKTGQIYRGISKRVQGFGGNKRRGPCFWCTKKRNTSRTVNESHNLGCQLFAVSNFGFGVLRVEPLAEIIGLKVRKFDNYILVVSQLLTKCTRVEFSQTCLRHLFVTATPFRRKKQMGFKPVLQNWKSLSGASFRDKKNHWRIPVHPVCQTARPITTQWDFRGQTTWFTCAVSHFGRGFLPQATEEFTARWGHKGAPS